MRSDRKYHSLRQLEVLRPHTILPSRPVSRLEFNNTSLSPLLLELWTTSGVIAMVPEEML